MSSRLIPAALAALLWTVLLAGFGWFAARPLAEHEALSAQRVSLEALGASAVALTEEILDSRTHLTGQAAGLIAQHPGNAPAVLRSLLDEQPLAITARVHSGEAPDELEIRNTRRAGSLPLIAESAWDGYQTPDSVALAVTTSPAGDSLVIATRAFFPIRGRQFMLTILWDASDLQRVLSTVPAGPDHRVRVTSARGTLVDGSRPGAPSGEDQQTVRVPFHHLSADLTISASTGPLTTPIRHLVLLLLAAAILIVILPAAIALGRSRRRA